MLKFSVESNLFSHGRGEFGEDVLGEAIAIVAEDGRGSRWQVTEAIPLTEGGANEDGFAVSWLRSEAEDLKAKLQRQADVMTADRIQGPSARWTELQPCYASEAWEAFETETGSPAAYGGAYLY